MADVLVWSDDGSNIEPIRSQLEAMGHRVVVAVGTEHPTPVESPDVIATVENLPHEDRYVECPVCHRKVDVRYPQHYRPKETMIGGNIHYDYIPCPGLAYNKTILWPGEET